MARKELFIKYLTTLKNEAINQNKSQGLELFSKILEQTLKPNCDIDVIIKNTQKSLGGILAHGSLNDKEFETIQKIFKL